MGVMIIINFIVVRRNVKMIKVTIEIDNIFGASINVDEKSLSSILSHRMTEIIEKELLNNNAL